MDPTVAAAMSAGTLAAPKVPLYFQITLRRSLIGLPWNTRYALGVLFKKYSPAKRYRPGAVTVRISTNTVIYREATSDVADLVVQLKEVLAVRNVWTVEEYREGVKALLGKRALTEDELQARRGYYVVGSAIPRKSVKTAKQASVTSADADASAEQAQATQ